jgi:hypothetical protein
MSRFERWLRAHFPYKEIGWSEIGERFTRYQLVKTRWFNIYLHQLYAPTWHPECHDHPWGFIAILLKRGYLERVVRMDPETLYTEDIRRRPGSILFRPATFAHNVITPYGESWSLILTTPKSRDWGFKPCDRPYDPSKPYKEYIDAQQGS